MAVLGGFRCARFVGQTHDGGERPRRLLGIVPGAAMSAQRDPPGLRAALPDLPRDESGPVFKAPWEAQAFAMTVALHERGAFEWKEWAATLAEVIAEVRVRGE